MDGGMDLLGRGDTMVMISAQVAWGEPLLPGLE